jgi:hypothetical protein
VSEIKKSYDVQVDWSTAVPLGDTLAVKTNAGYDDQWVKAFEVVLDEQHRRSSKQAWETIDFDYASNGKEARFAIFVRKVTPGARAPEVRQTIDELVKTANRVAVIGPHVYELARELREPETAPSARQGSSPPPATEIAAELAAS